MGGRGSGRRPWQKTRNRRWGWGTFTDQDIKDLQLLADGATLKQLTRDDGHVRSIYKRIKVMKEVAGAKTDIELVAIAMRKGFVR